MDLRRTKNCESDVGQCDAEPMPIEGAASAVKDEIVPLSGNPLFSFIVSRTQVHYPYQVLVPRRFYPFLPAASVPVILSYRNRIWKMKYGARGIVRRLYSGWKNFATDSDLKVGDGCVMELMDSKNIMFRVQILRRGVLPANGGKGRSFDAPILID